MSNQNAVSDVNTKKGGAAETVRPAIQDMTMLNVAEKAADDKTDAPQFRGFSEQHRAAMWLDEEVKKAKKGVTTQVVELTPALAEILLERNDANRRISPFYVDLFSRDIEHGAWRFNGEPIIIADDGRMNDGQHRCAAVIDAGKPLTVVLVIGVKRDTRTTLDQGRIRTIGDYLSMEGHIDANALGATCNYIWQWQTRGLLSSSGQAKPSKSEMLELIEAHPDIADSISVIPRKGAPAMGGLSMLAFSHWAFSRTAPVSEATLFMTKLTGGASLLSRDPILYIRNRLIAERGKLRLNDKAELIFRGWNASRRGETTSRLPILGGVLPVVES